jgi:hypothetical protein
MKALFKMTGKIVHGGRIRSCNFVGDVAYLYADGKLIRMESGVDRQDRRDEENRKLNGIYYSVAEYVYQTLSTLANKRTLSTKTLTISTYLFDLPAFAFSASIRKAPISFNSTSNSCVFSLSAGYCEKNKIGGSTLMT